MRRALLDRWGDGGRALSIAYGNHGVMVCGVCGGAKFVAVAYVSDGDERVPALECVHCHALLLDERVASTPQERESVRLAIADRTKLRDQPGPLSAPRQVELQPKPRRK